MKKLFFCLVAIAVLSGCQSKGSGLAPLSTSLGVITAPTQTGIRSLYISKFSAAHQTSALISAQTNSIDFKSLISTVAYINDTGNNVPVVFDTSSGAKVVLNVTSLNVIKDSFIVIAFNAMVEVQTNDNSIHQVGYQELFGNALIDMQSGNVYDISDYDTNPLSMLVDQNYLYTTKGFAWLYKIDLNNISSAIPLNNGAYMPAGTLYYILNNRIVAGAYSFDINGVTLPKPLTSVLLTSDQSTMTGPGEPFAAAIQLPSTRNPTNADPAPYMIDGLGNLWCYRYDSSGKIGKFQLSLDSNGNTVVSNYEEFTLNLPLNTWQQLFMINGNGYYADHLWVGDKSYFYVRRNADGGITFEGGASTFGNNYPGWAGNCASYYNGSLYWVSTTTLYSMNLSQNQLTQVYSSPNLINPVTMKHDNSYEYITLRLSKGALIFYQMMTPTTVGTYSLPIGSTEPVLISQSQADIDNIIELSF